MSFTKSLPRLAAALVGCLVASLTGILAVQALAVVPAGAASSTTVLHFYQQEVVTTFTNASNVVIQGYPPVGGHVIENDIDFVGNHSHHAKRATTSDHLYCTVVSAPANADCFLEFATGSSLIYADNFPTNLANSSATASAPINGATAKLAGDTGQVTITSIGNSNNSDVVISLHKR
jgi:hypothetical protein